MPEAYACSTLLFDITPEDIVTRYEEDNDTANGYLTRLDDHWVLVDALATETADWARQVLLGQELSEEGATAISLFCVGNSWAISVAYDGRQGPAATFAPDDEDMLDILPHRLLAVERVLGELFPQVDVQQVDGLFGAMLEGAMTAEEAFSEILAMVDVAPDWLRWSWYETIPEQLFTDPDLADRVIPLGAARQFWEE